MSPGRRSARTRRAVLLLSQYVETTHALRLLEHGTARIRYLLKDRVSDIAELADRERELLRLMAEGRSNSATATSLHISEKTVEGHVRSIFMKLELEPAEDDRRRILAVLTYLRA